MVNIVDLFIGTFAPYIVIGLLLGLLLAGWRIVTA